MTDESQPENRNRPTSDNPYKPKIVTTTPLIYEWQLRSMCRFGGDDDDDNESFRIANPYESYIYAFTGPRGAGKDESLSLLAIIFIANGIPAYLNFPLQFYYKRDGAGKAELLKAELIDMDKLLNHSQDYDGGLIGISEYQDWDNAMRSVTTQSLILHSFWDQIRKGDMSFAYTAKRLDDIAGKTVSETDFEICCMDITDSSYEDTEGIPRQRGAIVSWKPIIDRSGYLTKRMGSFLMPKKQPMYQIWGSFETKRRFDYFEAMRGVRLNLEKRVIGDAPEQADFDPEEILRRSHEIFQSVDKIPQSDFFRTLGVKSQRAKQAVKDLLMENMDIRQYGSAGRTMLKVGV